MFALLCLMLIEPMEPTREPAQDCSVYGVHGVEPGMTLASALAAAPGSLVRPVEADASTAGPRQAIITLVDGRIVSVRFDMKWQALAPRLSEHLGPPTSDDIVGGGLPGETGTRLMRWDDPICDRFVELASEDYWVEELGLNAVGDDGEALDRAGMLAVASARITVGSLATPMPEPSSRAGQQTTTMVLIAGVSRSGAQSGDVVRAGSGGLFTALSGDRVSTIATGTDQGLSINDGPMPAEVEGGGGLGAASPRDGSPRATRLGGVASASLLTAMGVLVTFVGWALLWHSRGVHRMVAKQVEDAPPALGFVPGTLGSMLVLLAWLAAGSVTVGFQESVLAAPRTLPSIVTAGLRTGSLGIGLVLASVCPSVLAVVQYSAASWLLRRDSMERGKPIAGSPFLLPTLAAAFSITASVLTIVRVVTGR